MAKKVKQKIQLVEGVDPRLEQMIGNAVPVNLGYYVADAIFRYSGA